jgi:hypothetical protein
MDSRLPNLPSPRVSGASIASPLQFDNRSSHRWHIEALGSSAQIRCVSLSCCMYRVMARSASRAARIIQMLMRIRATQRPRGHRSLNDAAIRTGAPSPIPARRRVALPAGRERKVVILKKAGGTASRHPRPGRLRTRRRSVSHPSCVAQRLGWVQTVMASASVRQATR